MQGKKLFKRTVIGAVHAFALAGATGSALAANWLMLQGTEPAGASARANVWGYVQAKYEKDFSDPNAAGGFVAPKMLGPELDTQDGFNIPRATIGIRGTGFHSTAISTISRCSRWATTESPTPAAPLPS